MPEHPAAWIPRMVFSAAVPLGLHPGEADGVCSAAAAQVTDGMTAMGYRMLGLCLMEPVEGQMWLRFLGEPMGWSN